MTSNIFFTIVIFIQCVGIFGKRNWSSDVADEVSIQSSQKKEASSSVGDRCKTGGKAEKPTGMPLRVTLR